MKQGSLHDLHLSLGARMTEFAGWDLPLHYGSILDEVRAVRSRAGLFDVSHMGRISVSGAGAFDLLQRMTTNDVGRLTPGHGQYTLMCNSEGGILDDLTVFSVREQGYVLVVNAVNTDKDLAWIRDQAGGEVKITDRTAESALFALQGPMARDLLREAEGELPEMSRFDCAAAGAAHCDCSVCRSGYTGEDGYELRCPSDCAAQVWETLLRTGESYGLALCGLGSRDVLRIEAGYVLYGNDIDEATNPVEAGLSRIVRMDKGEFVGREAIARVVERGPRRTLAGIRMEDRAVPRPGAAIVSGGETVGEVTSGTFSPTIERGIGLGYIDAGKNTVGLEVEIVLREKPYAGRVVRTPFYRS